MLHGAWYESDQWSFSIPNVSRSLLNDNHGRMEWRKSDKPETKAMLWHGGFHVEVMEATIFMVPKAQLREMVEKPREGGNRKRKRAGFNWWYWPMTLEFDSHFHSGLSSSISSNGNIPSLATSILSIITSHCPYLFLFHFLLFSIHFLFFPFSDLIPFCTLIMSSIICDSFFILFLFCLLVSMCLLPLLIYSLIHCSLSSCSDTTLVTWLLSN